MSNYTSMSLNVNKNISPLAQNPWAPQNQIESGLESVKVKEKPG